MAQMVVRGTAEIGVGAATEMVVAEAAETMVRTGAELAIEDVGSGARPAWSAKEAMVAETEKETDRAMGTATEEVIAAETEEEVDGMMAA